jgi:hypothetical protein
MTGKARDLLGEVQDVIDTYGVWDIEFVMDALLYDGKRSSFERALMRRGEPGMRILRRMTGQRSKAEISALACPKGRRDWQRAEERRRSRQAASQGGEAA